MIYGDNLEITVSKLGKQHGEMLEIFGLTFTSFHIHNTLKTIF